MCCCDVLALMSLPSLLSLVFLMCLLSLVFLLRCVALRCEMCCCDVLALVSLPSLLSLLSVVFLVSLLSLAFLLSLLSETCALAPPVPNDIPTYVRTSLLDGDICECRRGHAVVPVRLAAGPLLLAEQPHLLSALGGRRGGAPCRFFCCAGVCVCVGGGRWVRAWVTGPSDGFEPAASPAHSCCAGGGAGIAAAGGRLWRKRWGRRWRRRWRTTAGARHAKRTDRGSDICKLKLLRRAIASGDLVNRSVAA